MKPKNAFSPPAAIARDDGDLETYSRFLLGFKHEPPPPIHITSSKKKIPDPPVEWNDKHAKTVKVKGLKLPHKPAHTLPAPKFTQPPQPPLQLALAPTPVAPCPEPLPASVPAPKSLWAGLVSFAVMAVWRWRRMASPQA